MRDDAAPSPSDAPRVVTLREAFWIWCRVAALSFGGPAGQIAVMHRIIVEEKQWIREDRFLHALNYCMLLPGPEAQQLATYIGWLMHRAPGGLMAGTLFILPGVVCILALSVIYAKFQHTGLVQALFFGLKAAVMAIVIEAVLRIGKRVLKNNTMRLLAAASFVAIFFFQVPFPLVVVAAAAIGLVGGRLWPENFDVVKGHSGQKVDGQGADGQDVLPEVALTEVRPSWRRNLVVCATFATLWFGPLALVAAYFGPESVYLQEGLFFSQAAVVTFGGAYAVLVYIGQQAVERFHWLEPREMLDGLGMAETTPGPLIMVVQFVGFMAAYRQPGSLEPLAGGVLGSLITTWVTFVPCFFWIFLGAPYVERLRKLRLLSCALSSITAAVVGVVLNLAVWFALHTLFGKVGEFRGWGARLHVPDWKTLDAWALAIGLVACVLTFVLKRGMALTLAVCTVLGIVIHLLR